MPKKVCLILGNGFSIDFIRYMGVESPDILKKINITNLFAGGDSLAWPLDGKPGFLSHKNCPYLWRIGARSFCDSAKTLEILEKVVTCANVYSLKGSESIGENNEFLLAYKELVSYLKYLFIHYDNQLPAISDSVNEWPWAVFLKNLDKDPRIEEVTVVTYNYDLWLEKILGKLGINFEMPLLQTAGASKFKIYKPHGSISYLHKKPLPSSSFSINYKTLANDCGISDIAVSQVNLSQHTAANFLIPPAGEAGRNGSAWAKNIRKECTNAVQKYEADDLVVLCGLSYWHVDRAEIDALLNAMTSDIEMIYLNPSPSSTFDAVLNSLFSKYTHFTSSEALARYPL
jgi:hypothetical protein